MANITNIGELRNTLANLTQEIELPGGTFAPKMNAAAINDCFNAIEAAFNQLYEKLRQLEDLHIFAENYIQNEFKKNKRELDTAIQALDTAGDDYRNTSIQATTVSFTGEAVVADRNGTAVATADIADGNTIMANAQEINTAVPSQAGIHSNFLAYRRNKLPAGQYRVFYAQESPHKEKITESLDFLFPKSMEINFIRISPFNAVIKRAALIQENQEYLDLNISHYSQAKTKASGIHLELESGATKSIIMNIQENKDTFSDTEQEHLDTMMDTVFEQEILNSGGAL